MIVTFSRLGVNNRVLTGRVCQIDLESGPIRHRAKSKKTYENITQCDCGSGRSGNAPAGRAAAEGTGLVAGQVGAAFRRGSLPHHQARWLLCDEHARPHGGRRTGETRVRFWTVAPLAQVGHGLRNCVSEGLGRQRRVAVESGPGLFGWDDFTQLSEVRDLAKIFDQVEYAKWRAFRESEDSRYVGLTLPHTLMRLPYGQSTIPTESFNFEEDVDGTDHKKYLWGNAAYSFGTRLTEAFAMHNWCVAIRGVEGGGLVQGLPTHTFATDEGEVALKCPTEIAITDRREKEFSDLGFIPLVHCKGTDYAAFFGAQSANKSAKYDSEAANANARLSTQLQYIFAVSRFAHYLKAMMRDKIGSFMSRDDCSRFLNKWIMNYVTEDDTAAASVKAQYPLREARVDVVEVPGKPGVYKAVAFMKPHFQLDELSVSLRLVAELPKSQGK